MFVSEAIMNKARMKHLHLNSWVEYDEQASDRDPSVTVLDVCA